MSQNKIKPLLATKAEYDKIQYPVLATPKLDGIRCLMVDGVAMSRSMKPIPNKFIQEQLKGLHGLDGELMVNGDFNAVQSGIMKQTGEPDFTYHVFDSFVLEVGYEDRIDELEWIATALHPRIKMLIPLVVRNEKQLDEYLEDCLRFEFEGLMIRKPDGKYKFGRSTVKEGILLKIKRFFDDEATLVEITEKMHNGNALEEDELGYAKRSSCKENLIPAGTAGSCILGWNGIEFRVGFGPGITDKLKQEWWDKHEELEGGTVTFRYQELSKDGVPRFGKLVGFRHEDDL